jgi:hypothetical protein
MDRFVAGACFPGDAGDNSTAALRVRGLWRAGQAGAGAPCDIIPVVAHSLRRMRVEELK